MKLTLLITASTILLSACASPAQQTLNERLGNKSQVERKEILRLECLNEAEYSTNMYKNNAWPHLRPSRKTYLPDTVETSNLKKLCRKMTDNFATKGSQDKQLANECAAQITDSLNKSKNSLKTGHAQRMKNICEEMTGKSVIFAIPKKETK